MADVTLVALITAGASVVSGSIPLLINWARDAGRDKRAAAKQQERERSEQERSKREQCVRLLRLNRDFRVLVEDAYGVSGSASARVRKAEEVRQSAADIASQADEVEFMVPGVDAEVLALATAASHLVSAAEEKHREHGTPLAPDDFAEFDQCLKTFKKAARATFEEIQERIE